MSKKPNPSDKQSKLAESALWGAYCDACELHSAQVVLNGRFSEGKRAGEWLYRMEPTARLDSERGFVPDEAPTAWLDVVEVLARFRKSLAEAVKTLPHLNKLMDAPAQAIPERWTFRVRLELAELESVYSHEMHRRNFLKHRKQPEADAGNVLKERPMGEDSLRRFAELCDRLKMRCAEVGFATDKTGNWQFPSDWQSGSNDRMRHVEWLGKATNGGITADMLEKKRTHGKLTMHEKRGALWYFDWEEVAAVYPAYAAMLREFAEGDEPVTRKRRSAKLPPTPANSRQIADGKRPRSIDRM